MLGTFCHHCGEKMVIESDFKLKNILGQAIGAITNLDSKLFRTLKLLFFSPGSLSTEFIKGIRVPYMKPFQIFVISNIIFFIFLSETDLFRTPSKWYFVESYDGIKVMETVRRITSETGLDRDQIAARYDVASSNYAKGLLIVLIPFIALIGRVLTFKRPIAFGKHVIFATHFFSFVLLMTVIISQVIILTNTYRNRWIFIIPITILMTLYYILSFKKYYEVSWVSAILKGLIGIFLINVIIQFYKVCINLIALNGISA